MDLGLQDKVAIVTGASRGIGKGIALGFAAEGCKLVICARGEERLGEAADELRAAGADVEALALDITETDAPQRLVDAAVSRFGRVDVLVGNVGGNRRGAFEDLSDDDWSAIIDLNLTSNIRTSRAVVQQMKKQGDGGSIVFITSIFGREAGGKGLSVYNTTKSALISLSKIMGMELVQHGIRVNNIAPGSIRFPGGSWDRRCKEQPEAMAEFIEQNLPIGRFGTVEEVANAVVFLASPRASLITAASLNVDGGQSRSLI